MILMIYEDFDDSCGFSVRYMIYYSMYMLIYLHHIWLYYMIHHIRAKRWQIWFMIKKSMCDVFNDFSWHCDHCFSCSDMNLSQCWYQLSFMRSFIAAQFHFQTFVIFNRPTPIRKTTIAKQINSVNGSIVSHLKHETGKQHLSRLVFLT